MNGNRIILAAHRGDWFKCPENTIPAFQAAIRLGVDMIETDVRMSKDGELVLVHDRSVLRVAGIDRNIDDMTLAEIKTLDAGHMFSEEFAGTTIPTVKEFLELIKDTNVLVNWELKAYPGDFGEKYAYTVADKLMEHIYKAHGHKYPLHGQGIYRCRRGADKPEIPEEEIFTWCCLYPEQSGMSPVDFKDNFDIPDT